MEGARYSTLKSAESVILYMDEYDRKDIVLGGSNKFNVCDWLLHGVICFVWILSLPLTWYFSFKVVPQFERVVVFRLGRACPLKGPGLISIIPFVDSWKRVDMRMRAFKVPPQDILTLDHALIKLGADVQYRISDPISTYTLIQDIDHCLRVSGQSVLTKELCQNDLAIIEGHKLSLQQTLQIHMGKLVQEWGIEIARFELSTHTLIKAPGGLDPGTDEDCNNGDPEGGMTAILNVIKSFTSGGSSFQMQGMMPASVPGMMSQGTGGQTVPKTDGLTVDQLFAVAKGVIDADVCACVNATFEFHVADEHTTSTDIWFLDLKNSPGFVRKDTGVTSSITSSRVDVKFSLFGGDLRKMFYGLLKPRDAYMNGSIKVEGDLQTAMKLDVLIRKMQAMGSS